MTYQQAEPPIFQICIELGVILWFSPDNSSDPVQNYCGIDDFRNALGIPELQTGLLNAQCFQTLAEQNAQRAAQKVGPLHEIFSGALEEVVDAQTGKLSGRAKLRHKDRTRIFCFKK